MKRNRVVLKGNDTSLTKLDKILAAYEASGKEFIDYTIEGGLLDSHIIVGEGLKTAIVKEICLNEWSSDYSFRFYNKMPEKYSKVIDLLERDEIEKASKIFFS